MGFIICDKCGYKHPENVFCQMCSVRQSARIHRKLREKEERELKEFPLKLRDPDVDLREMFNKCKNWPNLYHEIGEFSRRHMILDEMVRRREAESPQNSDKSLKILYIGLFVLIIIFFL